MSNSMSNGMNNEPVPGAGDLERATTAIRRSAASLAPSSQSVQATLAALAARQQAPAPQRQAMAAGKGGLSLTEDALMKKWRFHDAFRPLSFESLERRRLLAAVTLYQDDRPADRRAPWGDCFFIPVVHARGDRPQRRVDAHPQPPGDESPVGAFDPVMPGGLEDLRSRHLFGSELIFAA